MTSPDELPAPRKASVLTHLCVVADQERSRE